MSECRHWEVISPECCEAAWEQEETMLNETTIGMKLAEIAADGSLTAEEKDAEVERLEREIERAEQEADPNGWCPTKE